MICCYCKALSFWTREALSTNAEPNGLLWNLWMGKKYKIATSSTMPNPMGLVWKPWMGKKQEIKKIKNSNLLYLISHV